MNHFVTYGQKANIEGQWRRFDAVSKSEDTVEQNGDLILNVDFTFTMVGYDDNEQPKTGGWNSGGTMKGTWSYSHDKLSFHVKNVPATKPPVIVSFQVLKLTSTELIFVVPTLQHKKLKFKRIKDFG